MKQTVKEAAREHQTHFEICDAEGTISGFINGVHKQSYESFISGAEWQSKQSPWISVEERLPEESGYYFITDGAVVINPKSNSLSNLSSIISKCNNPKNPHLKPKPSAAEVSGSY